MNLNRLEWDKRFYIDSHYPEGTRETMIALMLDPDISVENKEKISSVWAWIKEVLFYYYQVRDSLVIYDIPWDEIVIQTPYGQVTGVDFAVFNVSDPNIELDELMNG